MAVLSIWGVQTTVFELEDELEGNYNPVHTSWNTWGTLWTLLLYYSSRLGESCHLLKDIFTVSLCASWGELGRPLLGLLTNSLCIFILPLTTLYGIYLFMCLFVQPTGSRGASPFLSLSPLCLVHSIVLKLLAQWNQADMGLVTPVFHLLCAGPLIFFFMFVLLHWVHKQYLKAFSLQNFKKKYTEKKWKRQYVFPPFPSLLSLPSLKAAAIIIWVCSLSKVISTFTNLHIHEEVCHFVLWYCILLLSHNNIFGISCQRV